MTALTLPFALARFEIRRPRISNVVDVPNYVVSALLPEEIFQG
jgi:acetamidase/formamidase